MSGILEELARSSVPPKPEIFGVKPDGLNVDPEVALKKAVRISERRKKLERDRKCQTIKFPYGPVCIVNFADMHVGGDGVDYKRLWADIDLVLETAGMYIGAAGDLLDNYIVGKLTALQIMREFTVDEEWALVRKIIGAIAPKLLWSVSGNHDAWTYMLTGVDYFRDIHTQLAPGILYDRDEIYVDVYVGKAKKRWKIRHKWRGFSERNDTHAIEKTAWKEKSAGYGFDVGIMAHTHSSGLSRFFNNGGATGLAVIAGSYKRFDDYAKRLGLPPANEQCAVAVILDEDGGMITTDSLQTAARYMRAMYPGESSDERSTIESDDGATKSARRRRTKHDKKGNTAGNGLE